MFDLLKKLWLKNRNKILLTVKIDLLSVLPEKLFMKPECDTESLLSGCD